VDEEILRWLEARSGVTGHELAETIFSSGSVVAAQPAPRSWPWTGSSTRKGGTASPSRRWRSWGSASSGSRPDPLAEALEASRAAENLDFAALFVTDVKSQDSLLMVEGDEEVIRQIPYPEVEEGEVFRLDGIVSRKKQLLPFLTGILRRRRSRRSGVSGVASGHMPRAARRRFPATGSSPLDSSTWSQTCAFS
jgi:manganese-dependent inorganic pyrophosphatase